MLIFQLWLDVFFKPLEVWGRTVPHWKALRCGKGQTRGLSCGNTFIVGQAFLKSAYLLHKQGFVDSQMVATVNGSGFIWFSLMHTLIDVTGSPYKKHRHL